MGGGSVYCNVCGDRILQRDFHKGRAVTILKKNYCAKCMGDVVKAGAQTEAGREEVGTGLRRIRTQRIPKADAPPRFKLTMPFLIALGVIGLALLLLWIVLARGTG